MYMELERTDNSWNNLEEKEQSWGSHSTIKICYEATIIETIVLVQE